MLRRSDAGEADRIVTFYTRQYGKTRALAKAVRRPRSKLAGFVEPFTHSSLQFARGRNMDVLTQGETLHAFVPLKSDLELSSRAFYLTELVGRFTMEHVENQPLFDLLLATLEQLCQAPDAGMLLRYFEANLLRHSGYSADFYRCLGCNAPLKPANNYFSASGGGVLCPACLGAESLACPVTVDAIKVLRLLQGADYATAARVRIRPQLMSELEQLLRRHLEYLLERRVNAAAWLEKLGQENAAAALPPPERQPDAVLSSGTSAL